MGKGMGKHMGWGHLLNAPRWILYTLCTPWAAVCVPSMFTDTSFLSYRNYQYSFNAGYIIRHVQTQYDPITIHLIALYHLSCMSHVILTPWDNWVAFWFFMHLIYDAACTVIYGRFEWWLGHLLLPLLSKYACSISSWSLDHSQQWKGLSWGGGSCYVAHFLV